MKVEKLKLMFENLKVSASLIVICILGAIIRFYKLSELILYWDEPYHTVAIAAKPLSFNLTHDYGSMLYQILVHFLLPLGKLEFFSRLPAAVFGILIILGTYFVGKLFFGKREGIIAAIFVCFSPYLLNYSQYARAYTAFTFFFLLSLYFFFRAIKENKSKYWALYIIFTVISIYTHLITLVAVLIYVSFVGILLFEKLIKSKEKKAWFIEKKRLINFSASTLLLSIIVYFLRYPVEATSQSVSIWSWVAVTIERLKESPTIGFIPLINNILTHQIYSFPSLFYFFALFLIILGIVGCLIRLRKEDILILLSVTLPIIGFVSINPRAVFFISAHRYFIFILPLLFILAARGISFLISLSTSLVAYLGFHEKRQFFLKNFAITVLVLSFLLFEINVLKEYNIEKWKLGSLRMSEKEIGLLKDNAEQGDVIFYDSFPNKAKLLTLTPLYLNRGKKELMIFSLNRIRLITLLQQKWGLWLIFDRSLISDKKMNNISFHIPGIELKNVDGNSIIHWEAGKKPLIKSLIEMVKFLVPLHSDRDLEYRLLLANFYLLDRNIKQALQELEIIEKIKFLPAGEEKERERAHFFSRLINKFKMDSENSHKIVQNTIFSDITRMLFILGNEFFMDEKFEEALSIYDMCCQLSDEYDNPIATRYFALGNRFFRMGRMNAAISLVNKAITLNPHRYIHHLLLAEVYKKKGLTHASIQEYRKAFNVPFLTEKLLQRIVSKPRLFAIWTENGNWHFLWRSDKRCVFSGKLYFNKHIAELRKYRFRKTDILNRIKDHAVEFNLLNNNGEIKTLDIEIGKKSQLICDIRINDRINKEEIIFINSGKNPKKIPFSISSSKTRPSR
jgi:4-amino-4-deoxy-L-arabinose transferase-like glycosyltransferase/tetratricopeptide (TPR) repeat protein